MDKALRIARLDSFVFRAPIAEPRINAFGTQTDRPAVLLRLVDSDGVEGWGEVFCNWPSVAAEHRARLADSTFRPLVENRDFDGPEELFWELTKRTARIRLQSDERGPFDQIVSGLDIAAWDLYSRRAGQPLWRALAEGRGKESGAPAGLRVYGSGLAPRSAVRLSEMSRLQGVEAVKLKVGFSLAEDIRCLKNLRAQHGRDFGLMADANQAWTLEQAAQWLEAAGNLGLLFVEEPIAADSQMEAWHDLSRRTEIPLATGENLRGADSFLDVVERGGVRVIQPDVIKWGGLTALREVIDRCIHAGARIAPHYLAGGIGLFATAHLLAACAPEGWLEYDVSENPLRNRMTMPEPEIRNGRLHLPDGPGLGAAPELQSLMAYRVAV